HSGNILIHQGVIKLADFGLSTSIEAATNQSKRWRTLSSGRPPFYIKGKEYDIGLAIEILQGLRKRIVPDSSKDYVNIQYITDNEPENRLTMNTVIDELNAIIINVKIMDYNNMKNDESNLQLF
ncbi:7372_t:CDS:2, partial [Funneliformis geosporum]